MPLHDLVKKTLDELISDDQISDAIEDFGTDSPEILAEAIKERLDIDHISEVISERIMSMSLTFNRDSYAHLHCDSCGKPFGDFISKAGFPVSPTEILHHGKNIVIVDDL